VRFIGKRDPAMARRGQPYDPNAVKRHDRTGAAFYAHLPASRAIACEIGDPYGVPADAQAKLVTPHGVRPSDVVHEWQAPTAPRLLVARTRRDDAIGGLFARGQIDQAAYKTARQYQELVERAGRGIHSPSLEPRVQGVTFDGLNDVQLRAARRQCRVAAEVLMAIGRLGLSVMHAVAVDGLTLHMVAITFLGDCSQRTIDFAGRLLRRVLDELALILGDMSPARGRSSCRLSTGPRPPWSRRRRRGHRSICFTGHKNNTNRVPKS
jgi:hypothetical protein